MQRNRTTLMAIILVVALAVSFFAAGCAPAGKNFVGVWKLKGMINNGETVPKESMEALEKNGMTIFTEFKQDGSFVLTLFGEATQGTYKVDGDKATISIDDTSMIKDGTATIEGDALKIQSADNKTTLEFERSSADAVTATPTALDSTTSPVALSPEAATGEATTGEAAQQ